MTIPSVGRIVHYVGATGKCRAAVVSDAQDLGDGIGLAVLHPAEQPYPAAVEYDENQAVGTWHWPERV